MDRDLIDGLDIVLKSAFRNFKSAILVGALLLALSSFAEAQQPKKVSRVGYLSSTDATTDFRRSEPIRLALRQLGYIERQNIAIEYRYGEGKSDRFPELATELVRLKVDAIVVAGGDLLVRAVFNATKTIPVIMTGGGADPVGAGFVKSLARLGGNVTGLTNLVNEVGGKRLELFKEAVPKLVRVGVIHDQANPANGTELREVLPAVARAQKMTIETWEVHAQDDFDNVFAAIGKQHPDGLYVSTGALLNSNRKRIVGFALKNRLPSVYGRSEYVTEGGLMYYGADEVDSYRRVAYFVDKILKGAKPADLPVEQPTKFEFVINLKTAKALNLTIPQSVLYRADRVIR